MIIGVLGWVVLGTIAGFIASKIIKLRGDDPRMGIASGAIGGFIGGWMYSLFSGSEVIPFNGKSLLFAALAAVIALAAFHTWRWKASFSS